MAALGWPPRGTVGSYLWLASSLWDENNQIPVGTSPCWHSVYSILPSGVISPFRTHRDRRHPKKVLNRPKVVWTTTYSSINEISSLTRVVVRQRNDHIGVVIDVFKLSKIFRMADRILCKFVVYKGIIVFSFPWTHEQTYLFELL